MPIKYSDISKPSDDILNDDYTSKVSLKCKKNAGGVGVTLETEQGEGGSLASKIGTKFSYAKFNVDKGQVKADGGKVLETSIKVSPECKVHFKASKGADLGVDYTSGNFFGTAVVDVKEMSSLTSSGCLALPASGLHLGADAKYALAGAKSSTSGITSFNIGAGYTSGPLYASVTATSKLSQFNLGVAYKVNNDLKIASQTIHTSAKMCDVVSVGGVYTASDLGVLKAKAGSDGVISACLIRDIAPKVTLTVSGSMSASDVSTFKPGLGITM